MCAAGRDPNSYVDRAYRTRAEPAGLVSSIVQVKETDLHILADREVREQGLDLALMYRLQIEKYIAARPEFAVSLVPLRPDGLAPGIVREMFAASRAAEVGPMAAVAGVMAEYVGRALINAGCREVIVENGGDIFVQRTVDSRIAIFAGTSPLSLKVGLFLKKEGMPVAVCTSSGSVGHSLSFGKADSVTVVANSAALADAAATRLGNEAGEKGGERGIKRVLDVSRTIEGVIGTVVIRGGRIGAVGDIELVKLG
jgi:ApbE superfamily uncharacterized protein (UPF0280 family)